MNPRNPSTHPVVLACQRIAADTEAHTHRLAAMASVSTMTMKRVLEESHWPGRAYTQRSLTAFAAKNEGAKSPADLRAV